MEFEKFITLERLSNYLVNDVTSLNGSEIKNIELINSYRSLIKYISDKKVYRSIKLPAMYISLTDGREFVVSYNYTCATRVGTEWILVKDTGWYSWYET